MALGYFNNFPKIYYDLNGDNVSIDYSRVTNIVIRLDFVEDLKRQSDLYYQYTIRDADTPENIANRYYGDPNYFWIVLLFNSIMDPQFDWPLDSVSLDNKIIQKYGQSHINDPHHYELRISSYDVPTQTTTEFVYIIDETTYNATPEYTNETVNNNTTMLTTTTAVVANYDYEVNENEKKRQINILKKDYLGQVQKELEQALSNA